MNARFIVLYDATCGLCQRSQLFLNMWLKHPRHMRFVDVHSEEASHYLDPFELSSDDTTRRMHIIDVEKIAVFHAEEAVGLCLEQCIAPWSWIGHLLRLPFLKGITRPAYGWVAERRHRFLPTFSNKPTVCLRNSKS
jgi:predicted DCC family thiol-disulfide oxidoreductase YuxK